MSCLDILIKARALIQKGWVKGAFECHDEQSNKYCIVGALRAVSAPYSYDYAQAIQVLAHALPSAYKAYVADVGSGCLMGFNDAGGTKQKDVLALFEKAIGS